jgi:hypothetical protein
LKKTVRLKSVVAAARHLNPEMTGEIVATPGMELDSQYTKVLWSEAVTVWGPREVWEYTCDLEFIEA